MNNDRLSLVILAAGKGTRMKSAKAKVLHELFYAPMIHHVLNATAPLQAEQTVVIVGHQKEQVIEAIDNFEITPVTQKEQLGTGHAVRIAESAISNTSETVMILCGDTPLIRSETLFEMVQQHHEKNAALTVLTTILDNPTNYGRMLLNADNKVMGIVEEKDASLEQRKIQEINGGIYCVKKDFLFNSLQQVGDDNSQGEIYLTDIVAIGVKQGVSVERFVAPKPMEVLGVNSRIELSQAHQELQARRNVDLMGLGITMHSPETISVSPDATIGQDCLLMPGVQVLGRSAVGSNCTLHPGVILHDCQVGDNVVIGPYAVLRNHEIEAGSQIAPHTVS